MSSASAATAASLVRPAIATLAGYVPGEQPQAGKWIKLNTNENPYPPSPAVARAIAAAAEGRSLAKYPDPLATVFRVRAAEVLGVDPDWIICGNGSDDLLTILVRTFVGEGERLRIAYPSYILYRTLAGIQGADCEEVMYERDWSLPEAFVSPRDMLRLAFLANPNSPSGTLIAPEQVAEFADRLSCPLVVDEAYGDFAEADCLELVRRCERVIVTRSLSKSYALAGLRFGFAIARPEIIAELRKVKDSYNCDALAIAAATAAIDDRAWLADNQRAIRATRRRLTDAMRALGFDATESQANFVWCTHAERPLRPIFEALKARGILIRFMEYPGWGDGLRITVGTDAEIDAFLAVMKTL
ncbi:MAG: histidinol-phosphate transaminase [Planctomycetota bacterium]|jgi:histidinol-phosphate aminotransferase|nr:histidinol-phosphate transaminase [Planctomycetota bacterium]MDA1200392.1 histidinol-phosphate transaminase [Planctomycetota bacterium]